MPEAPIPANESRRLAALLALDILDTTPEPRFEQITRLARTVFDVPIVLITLIDHNRQWFKSCIGMDVAETGRDVSFCAHALEQDVPLVIPDALQDVRFADNPLVTGDPHIRFYAGCPLDLGEGLKGGTLCVIDRKPRAMSPHDIEVLQDLGAMASRELLQITQLEILRDLRTAEVAQTQAQAQLAAALKVAEQATRAKSEFLANMSHELRTPLNSVIGFAEMLEDAIVGPLNDEQLDFVQTIDRNGRHLLQMINGILDIAKIEAGMLVLHLETADICPIIREIGDVFRPLAQKKNLTLQLPADGLSVPLSIDPQRCRQVMLNLLSNAIKFTPAGGRIVVAVIETAETVSIAVTDSGIGIAAADHERVFQEFVQIDGSYARKQEGTGLGLPLARRLVMLQGGELWLESAIGQGSTFGVTLPKGPQPGVTTASARHSGALG